MDTESRLATDPVRKAGTILEKKISPIVTSNNKMTICLRDLLTDKYNPSKMTATIIAEITRVRMFGKK